MIPTAPELQLKPAEALSILQDYDSSLEATRNMNKTIVQRADAEHKALLT